MLKVNGRDVTGPPTSRSHEDDRLTQPHGETRASWPGTSMKCSMIRAAPRRPHQCCRGAGRYFVSGDNRLYSNDSRHWGTVGREEINWRSWTDLWS